jgi:Gas vesicle synthesis protein GvpO
MTMARQSIRAREAAQIAPKYLTEITGREPAQMTAVEPTDEDGWIVEVEIVEDRRIPSAADMLALYEIELGPDGDLLGYSRRRRYRRTEGLAPSPDSEDSE